MAVRPYVISAPVQPQQYMLVNGRPPVSPMSRELMDQSRSSVNMDQSLVDNSDKNGSSSKFSLPTLLVGALIGLVVCGIPLAVITTLYVQEKSQSSSSSGTGNSSSSGSSGSSTVNLPSQCNSYTIIADNTRSSSYSSCSGCYCDSGLSTGWYRIVSPAGTQLSTSPVSSSYCGTNYPGWFNGSFPTTAGSTTAGTVCVNVNGNLCHSTYSVSGILVTNCDTFYVFNMRAVSYCYTRYCTS